MAVTIRIPTTFRELTKGNSSICSDGRTLGQLLEQVRTEYPSEQIEEFPFVNSRNVVGILIVTAIR